jgi:tetratricopeptide (TPR) repeat protein
MSQSELRVFVSSTFRDMQPEREVLVRRIFPEVRARCRERGVTFTEIDLRWGVTAEEALDGGAVDICLQEVRRSPFFIGLLGSRYGWVPTLEDIPRPDDITARFGSLRDAIDRGMSITEMEIREGVLHRQSEIGWSRFYFRSNGETEEATLEDEDGHARLDLLRNEIVASGAPVRSGYDDAVTLGEWVRSDLLALLDEVAPVEIDDPLQRERRYHTAFAASRRQAYVAAPDQLATLDSHFQSDPRPLVVTAPSGSGKSSLLAYWAGRLGEKSPGIEIIEHYVAIGSGAGDHYALLRHVIAEIRDRFAIERPMPATADALESELPDWLGSVDRPTVIILDGLNQLAGRGAELAWLPTHIPSPIDLVVSTTDPAMALRLAERGWSSMHVEPLDAGRRASIISTFLGSYRKALTEEQMARVVQSPHCALPLFLRTLLEELRVFATHDDLDHLIDHYLDSSDTDDLFQRVLARLELDHGESTVRETLTSLHASRNGLSENELLELLGVPRMALSRLLIGLDFNLVQRDGLYGFFHDFLRHAVDARYLAEDGSRRREHRRLGEYFHALAIDNRRCDEEPWQWQKAGEEERLCEALVDVEMFARLATEEKLYELIGYWRELADRYDPVEEYEASFRRSLESYGDAQAQVELLRRLGELHMKTDRFAAARAVYQAALERARANAGETSVMAADCLDEIADAMFAEGKYEESEETARRALQIQSTFFPEGDARICLSLDLIMRSLFTRGELVEAEEIARRSLALSERDPGTSRVELTDRLNSLASILTTRNLNEEAISIMSRVLDIQKEALGERHPQLGHSLMNLGVILRRAGRLDEAVDQLRKAVEILTSALGEHSYVALAYNNLSVALVVVGDLENAEREIRRAVEMRQKILGMNHPRSVATRLQMANVLRKQGHFAAAEAIYRDDLPRQFQSLGPTHPESSGPAERFADLLRASGRSVEANNLLYTVGLMSTKEPL